MPDYETQVEDGEEEVIGSSGMEQLFSDLEVEPEDVVTIILAWKMNAEKMGVFKYSEFLVGLSSLQ